MKGQFSGGDRAVLSMLLDAYPQGVSRPAVAAVHSYPSHAVSRLREYASTTYSLDRKSIVKMADKTYTLTAEAYAVLKAAADRKSAYPLRWCLSEADEAVLDELLDAYPGAADAAVIEDAAGCVTGRVWQQAIQFRLRNILSEPLFLQMGRTYRLTDDNANRIIAALGEKK